jgi:hypothetical protein
MPNFIHKELAAGKWFTLSLPEQLANIGSEVGRARRWQGTTKRFSMARLIAPSICSTLPLPISDGVVGMKRLLVRVNSFALPH